MGVLRGSGGLGVCAASLSLCLWLCVWMTRTSAGLSPYFFLCSVDARGDESRGGRSSAVLYVFFSEFVALFPWAARRIFVNG